MVLEYSREEVIYGIRAAVITLVLYMIDPLSMLFTVPLHYLGLGNRSRPTLVLAASASVVAVAVRELIRFRGVPLQDVTLVFFFIGVGIPLMLLVSAALFYLVYQKRMLYRLMVILASAGLVWIILAARFRSDAALAQRTVETMASVLGAFFPEEGSAAATAMTSRQVAELSLVFFERGFLAYYMLQFSAGFGIAWELHKRKRGIRRSLLAGFRVPEWFVYVFLGSWAVNLLDIIVGLGFLGIIGWNVGLASAMIYMLQGMAVLRHWLSRKRGIPVSGLRVAGLLALVMLVPGFNMIALTALAIVGVTEIWITYRKEEGVIHESDS